MRTALIPAIFVSVALMMLGNGLVSTFVGVRLTLREFPVQTIGLVMASFYLGLLAGAVWCARVVGRVGHIRAFAAFAGITTVAVLVHGLIDAPYAWAVLRAVMGFSLAGLYLVVESWLNERSTNQNRGRVFSLYVITCNLALAGGHAMMMVGDPLGREHVVVAAMLFAACLIPIALTRAVHPAPVTVSFMSAHRLYARSHLGVTGALASGLILGAFLALGPTFALMSGLGVDRAALLMSVTLLGGLTLQWPLGHLSDTLGRRNVVRGVTLVVIAAAIGIALLASRYEPGLYAAALLFGGAAYTLYPLSVAHANDRMDPKEFVAASGSLLQAWGLGALVGPIVAAQAMALSGASGLFYYITGVGLVLAAITFLQHETGPEGEVVTPFVPVVRTSPVISQMDPRCPDPPCADEAAEDAAR